MNGPYKTIEIKFTSCDFEPAALKALLEIIFPDVNAAIPLSAMTNTTIDEFRTMNESEKQDMTNVTDNEFQTINREEIQNYQYEIGQWADQNFGNINCGPK